ncbi:MAG: GGDEF domain-containing protein [Mycobacterium sp.]
MDRDISTAEATLRWWRQPDHFDWITGYLRARGILRNTRFLIALMTLSLVVTAVPLMFSPAGPGTVTARLIQGAGLLGGLAFAVRWAVRWPTKRGSIAFILGVNLCIAAVCQVQSNHLVGLVGAAAFAVTGGYIALFHTAKYLAYNFVVAGYIAVLQAFRYGLDGDVALALSALFLVLTVNFAVPIGLQDVVHALGGDVVRSDRDPLTGLLNRRAFFDRIDALMLARPAGRHFLTVTMVDLDRFKLLNDTDGHAAGDEALVAVSEVLRAESYAGSLVGRVGGEEFLIADLVTTAAQDDRAQHLCDAIAGLRFSITASVGTAVGRIDQLGAEGQRDFMHRLCKQADSAMYDAKRNGGNQVRHIRIGGDE